MKESGAQAIENLRYRNAKHTDALFDKIEKSRLAKAFPALLPSEKRREKVRNTIQKWQEKQKNAKADAHSKDDAHSTDDTHTASQKDPQGKNGSDSSDT